MREMVFGNKPKADQIYVCGGDQEDRRLKNSIVIEGCEEENKNHKQWDLKRK